MPPDERAPARARLPGAVGRLLGFHRRSTWRPGRGGWRTPTGHAWQPAVAVEAVLTAYEVTSDPACRAVVAASFARYRGRRSRFCDDDGWYLNVWLHAFDSTGERVYLAEAEALFAAMAQYWDQTCDGGVWWRRDRSYKNAITNELFLLAAARLARRADAVRTSLYREWAERAWAWWRVAGMVNRDGLVNDGLGRDCTNNGGTTWTYNQGVILAGLAELWRLTADREALALACRIADAATVSLVHPAGVLREPGETDLIRGAVVNRDAHAFKGIFVTGLARLTEVADGFDPAPYREFIDRNARSLTAQAGDGADGYGLSWVGPPGPVDAATQAAACLLLGEAARLEPGPGFTS